MGDQCSRCGRELDETGAETVWGDNGSPYCFDCYFELETLKRDRCGEEFEE